MVKAICCRLNEEILTFIDTIPIEANRSDKIRAVLLWLKEYQGSYLESVQDYFKVRITKDS